MSRATVNARNKRLVKQQKRTIMEMTMCCDPGVFRLIDLMGLGDSCYGLLVIKPQLSNAYRS